LSSSLGFLARCGMLYLSTAMDKRRLTMYDIVRIDTR
jgi:hypothetical protein